MRKIIFVLTVFTLFLCSCGSEMTENRPDDFSFSIVWNTYGISYYNSETGSLVKTTDATNSEDYVTTMRLTSDALDAIYAKIAELDMDSYPTEYDPFDGEMSEPSQTLILTCGDKRIVCEDISLSAKSNNRKGQKFLDTMRFIIETVTATEEWQSLPEYEFFYE